MLEVAGGMTARPVGLYGFVASGALEIKRCASLFSQP
jgi:hypothetical protein